MTIQSSAMYKDVNPQDFDHYFRGTCMVWNLSPNKKRLFVVDGYGDGIAGQYLTRDKEWKEKKIAFQRWWEVLDTILPHPVMFNFKDGCGTWFPQLARNLKKSFPFSTQQVKLLGNVTPEEAAEQSVAATAFEHLYGPVTFPSAEEALNSARSATATQGGFVFDKKSKTVYFKRTLVGYLNKDKVEVTRTFFRDLLVNESKIDGGRIVLIEPSKLGPQPIQTPPADAQIQFTVGQQGGPGMPGNNNVAFNTIWYYGGAQQEDQAAAAAAAQPQPPHQAGTMWHQLRPLNSIDKGWRIDVYMLGSVERGLDEIVMPRWGSGYLLGRAHATRGAVYLVRRGSYHGPLGSHYQVGNRVYIVEKKWELPG